MALRRARYNVFIDHAQLDALRAIKERDGILPAEQIRRAIDLWLAQKGAKRRTRRRRAIATRGPKRH